MHQNNERISAKLSILVFSGNQAEDVAKRNLHNNLLWPLYWNLQVAFCWPHRCMSDFFHAA